MLDGPGFVNALRDVGVTDVVWIPDSDLGRWHPALSTATGVRLLRVCREGEAFALAGGLWLGGRSPLVMVQCTGLFEAGDALRNILFDMAVPLPVLVGVRSAHAWRQGKTSDTCPQFTEPVIKAWGLPYVWATPDDPAMQIRRWIEQVRNENQARVLLWPE